eukprot:6738276-Prymnesium_polylepis.1
MLRSDQLFDRPSGPKLPNLATSDQGYCGRYLVIKFQVRQYSCLLRIVFSAAQPSPPPRPLLRALGAWAALRLSLIHI